MGKRIVIALGGNALGKNLHEQMDAVHVTAKAIADLIEDGHEVVIAHGNGPQVGMIQNAFAAYHKQEAKSDIMPLSVCVAMSQGYIGYDLQNLIGEELDRRGLGIHCATVLTQVAVNPADPAFQHPTKPIGAFMTEEEAKKLAAEKGIDVLKLAMLLALGCSMRMGEILGLTWDCVNLSEEALASGNASLFINKELKRCEKSSVEALEKRGRSKGFFTFPEWKRTNCKTMLTLKTPKTDSSVRTVFLPKTVALALIETKQQRTKRRCCLALTTRILI